MAANLAPVIKTVVCETSDGTGGERVSRPIHNVPFRLVETGMECPACEGKGEIELVIGCRDCGDAPAIVIQAGLCLCELCARERRETPRRSRDMNAHAGEAFRGAVEEAEMTITPEQVKAARRLIGWSQEDLAGHVGVSETTIGEFETDGRLRLKLSLAALRAALESAGIEFTYGGEPGVKLKAKAP